MLVPNNLYRTAKPLIGTVVENRLLSPSDPFERQVCHITIRYNEPFSYIPGQSVGMLPGTDPKTGKPHHLRLFSVASARKGDSGDGQTVSLCVVRLFWDNPKTGEKHIPGVASNYACDLKKGDQVQLTGPVGRHFLLPEDFKKRDLVFVATGTGIAPYRGMLKEMFEAGYQGQAWLFFGAQTRERVLYDKEFQAYEKYPNFHFRCALSREETNPFSDRFTTRENRMYVQTKILQEGQPLQKALLKPETLMFICGLKGMEKGILPVLDYWGQKLEQPAPWSAVLKTEKRLIMEVY